jgi:hypothetical protein
MRFLLLPFLLALQGRAELKPKFQKFDRVAVSCTVQTEVKSSNGRDSKYSLELALTAEAEKVDGEAVVFDCGVSSLKIAGRLDGRTVNFEWSKAGTERGERIASIQKALEKGWKFVLAGKKGFSVTDTASELGDTLPLFNPGVFLGLSAPLPDGPVEVGKGWEVKDLGFPYFGGFTVRYAASLDLVKGDTAKISSRLFFNRPESEVPVEGVVNVKGDGDASLEYDLRSGRPNRGATALKLTSQMGGLKRDVSQVIEFEVRR